MKYNNSLKLRRIFNMAYLGKNPIKYVNVVYVGSKKYNYTAFENMLKNCISQLTLENTRIEINYCNARGDIKCKVLNWKTREVEKQFILKYHPNHDIIDWGYNLC